MSHDVYANIVPFIIRYADGDDDTKNMVGVLPVTSWTLDLSDLTELGEYGDIHGICWRKKDKVVWMVNESHYSNGGDHNMSVVANDKESITEFCRDWEISGEIEENAICYISW